MPIPHLAKGSCANSENWPPLSSQKVNMILQKKKKS